MARFKIKRIYDPSADTDGYRVLVDRLWPRGLRKKDAKLDGWNKEVAPSTALRKWFDHRPDRFEAFSAKYREELAVKASDLTRLRDLAKKSTVTLLYAAKDEKFNHANVLMHVLES